MSTIERRCPNGHLAAPDAAFCTRCGAALDAPHPPLGFVAPPAPTGYAAAPPPPPYAATPPVYATPLGAPAAPYGYARAPFCGYAVAAFLVSLVWLYAVTSIAAIVLAVVALRRIRERNERGRGLAVTAIVLGGLGIVIGIGILLGRTG